MNKNIKVRSVWSMLFLGCLTLPVKGQTQTEALTDRFVGVPAYQRTIEVIGPALICEDAHVRTHFSVLIHHKGRSNIDAVEADSVRRAIAWGRKYFGQTAQLSAQIEAYADLKMQGHQASVLSDQRAYAASRLLMSESIPASNIQIVSYGHYNPEYKTDALLAGATHVKVHVVRAADVQKCQQQYPGSSFDSFEGGKNR